MWDDIIIGRGEEGCTAFLCSDIDGKHSISDNNISYWINDCIMNTGCIIFKNTKEGQKIDEMRRKKNSIDIIQNYIDSLILKRIKVDKIKIALKGIQDEYFRMGEKSKQDEMKSVLGVS